jgi:hypothetical protein
VPETEALFFVKNSKKTDKYEKVLKKSVDLNSLEILGISAVENGKTSILNLKTPLFRGNVKKSPSTSGRKIEIYKKA